MGDMSPTQHEVFERLMVERLKAWMIWATRELSTCVLWFLNFFAKTIFKNWHNGGHVPYFLTYMFLTIRFLAVYWLKKSILTKVKGIMRTFHIWAWFCYCLMGDIVLMPPTRHEVFFTLKVGKTQFQGWSLSPPSKASGHYRNKKRGVISIWDSAFKITHEIGCM